MLLTNANNVPDARAMPVSRVVLAQPTVSVSVLRRRRGHSLGSNQAHLRSLYNIIARLCLCT